MKRASYSLLLLSAVVLVVVLPTVVKGLLPYGRLWDMMVPQEGAIDPFRILEQSPVTVSKAFDTSVSLARADWKETAEAHFIYLDVPGVKKSDLKIEVEEGRVLRITGERKSAEESEGEKWHTAERPNGRFWRQFRLPYNADLQSIKAQLENGVLKVTVPKLLDERKRQARVIDVIEDDAGSDVATDVSLRAAQK